MDMDKSVQQMEDDVYKLYPETEGDVPLNRRKGMIPTGIREELETAEREAAESPAKKRKSIHVTKNATPGDIAMNIENCLDDIRPKAFCFDANPSDCTTPDVLREGGLERYSDLHIQTGNQLMSQWESKYFSQILPFVFPRMCSGPDFTPDKLKWQPIGESVGIEIFLSDPAFRVSAHVFWP